MSIWRRLKRLEAAEESNTSFRASFKECCICGKTFHSSHVRYVSNPSYAGYSIYCETHKPPYDRIDYMGRMYRAIQVDVNGNEINKPA
jgi:hypothetical protein